MRGPTQVLFVLEGGVLCQMQKNKYLRTKNAVWVYVVSPCVGRCCECLTWWSPTALSNKCSALHPFGLYCLSVALRSCVTPDGDVQQKSLGGGKCKLGLTQNVELEIFCSSIPPPWNQIMPVIAQGRRHVFLSTVFSFPVMLQNFPQGKQRTSARKTRQVTGFKSATHRWFQCPQRSHLGTVTLICVINGGETQTQNSEAFFDLQIKTWSVSEGAWAEMECVLRAFPRPGALNSHIYLAHHSSMTLRS
jgi:hypothetical protein